MTMIVFSGLGDVVFRNGRDAFKVPASLTFGNSALFPEQPDSLPRSYP